MQNVVGLLARRNVSLRPAATDNVRRNVRLFTSIAEKSHGNACVNSPPSAKDGVNHLWAMAHVCAT